MPTRNRPALFERALKSVLSQTWKDVEILVVNDGSDDEHARDYGEIIARHSDRAIFRSLARRPKGHGPSYAINTGAYKATGAYVCFLDDDDYWTDQEHLGRAALNVQDTDSAVQLYMANQVAVGGDRSAPQLLWIAALTKQLERESRKTEMTGAYEIAVDDLLATGGFCHLNTLIVRRDLYLAVGGMDETIRWEGDRDLFLRLIDRAQRMRYAPFVVSLHNIPDAVKSVNETTRFSELERRFSQLKVLDKAASFAAHPGIRAHGRRHRTWTLKRIAEVLAALGDIQAAAYYARAAFGTGPTFKWAGYTAWLSLRALIARRKSSV